jgi:parallel beta-helix repeat protein
MKKCIAILAVLGMVMGIMALWASPALAVTTWDVYDGGSIQGAIDNASAGDTIVVHPGTYNEQILINKQLTIQSSDGAAVTIIDGEEGTANEFQLDYAEPPPGSPPDIVYRYYPVVRVDTDGVVFEGFTVQGAAPITGWLDEPTPNECGMGIAILASNCHIENNIIPGSPWAIFMAGSGNVINGTTALGSLNVDEPSVIGIYFLGDDNQITANNLSGGALGIFGMGQRNHIVGNTISYYWAGIAIWWGPELPVPKSSDNEIINNQVYDSSNTGISSNGDNTLISGNIITKQASNWAGYLGIGLQNASNCQIINNSISYVVIAGIALNNSHYNEISGNTISNFIPCEVEEVGTATLEWTGERTVFGLTSAKIYSGDSPGDGVIIKIPFSGPLALWRDQAPMFWAYLYDVNARPRVNFVLDLYGDGTTFDVMEGVDSQAIAPDYWEPQIPSTLDPEAWRAMTPTDEYYDSDNSAGQGWNLSPATMQEWRTQFPGAIIVEIQTIYGMWESMYGKTAYLDGHTDGSRWGIEQSAQGIIYGNSYNNNEHDNTITDSLIINSVAEYISGPQTDYTVTGAGGTDTTVTIDTNDSVTVTVLLYAQNPEPEVPFPDAALGKFIDISVSDANAVIWPVRVEMAYSSEEVSAAGIDENTLGLYYWDYDNGVFQRCSDTGVDTVNKVIWANVTEDEASRLVGTPFTAGGALQASIDIKPSDFPNVINLKSKGVIPVVVLGSDSFDVKAIDPATIKFGPTGNEAPVNMLPKGKFQYSLEDVNKDGYMDIVFHFDTQATGFIVGDTAGIITGKLYSGTSIEGSDSVSIIP